MNNRAQISSASKEPEDDLQVEDILSNDGFQVRNMIH
jgi:hypothetical protein